MPAAGIEPFSLQHGREIDRPRGAGRVGSATDRGRPDIVTGRRWPAVPEPGREERPEQSAEALDSGIGGSYLGCGHHAYDLLWVLAELRTGQQRVPVATVNAVRESEERSVSIPMPLLVPLGEPDVCVELTIYEHPGREFCAAYSLEQGRGDARTAIESDRAVTVLEAHITK